jgi:hypothetical protein
MRSWGESGREKQTIWRITLDLVDEVQLDPRANFFVANWTRLIRWTMYHDEASSDYFRKHEKKLMRLTWWYVNRYLDRCWCIHGV